MTKLRWKVILPKRGNLCEILNFLHGSSSTCLNVVITEPELSKVNQVTTDLKRCGLQTDIGIKFTTFRPKCYEACLTTALPYVMQLPRSVYGESSLLSSRPKRAKQIAEQEVAKLLMGHLIGADTVETNLRDYGSYSDMMFSHCHLHSIPSPRFYTYQTHTTPNRCMSIVSCRLIREPGIVTLKGGKCNSYGAALEASCCLLEKVINSLKVKDLLHEIGTVQCLKQG